MKAQIKSELIAILEEESERLKDLRVLYREKIENLPKGYISIKKINGHEYAYLAFREKNRIRSKYIGKPSSPEVDEIKKQIEKRKEVESKIRVVKERMKELQRMLRSKKM
ncbi:MAG: hypothetical protein RAO92_02625 [Candidatus Euphemobacter frigidus]|nr:hypothetical protein [Candidatus Euphemobacter frigidus]MDP8275275.1 hypothetical protein [Candidatus Euphemobacter frigidus]